MPENPVAALYYPYSRLQSNQLLKTGLLLWDFVECIDPRHFPESVIIKDRNIAAATEILVRRRRPSPAEKAAVDHRLREIFRAGIPTWVHATAGPEDLSTPYSIYPDKMADETWRLLEFLGIAEADGPNSYSVPPAVGLLAMALLAEECSGSTKTQITDRATAYKWLFGLMTTELGGQYFPSETTSHLAASYDRLVTMSVKIVNTDRISLERLLRMRKREARSTTSDLQSFRRNYLAKIDAYVKRLIAPDVTDTDRDEISRQFDIDIREDMRLLKEELKFAAKEVIYSKEVGICVLAVAGAVAVPASLPAAAATLKSVGIGALLGVQAKYSKARRKALREHPASWLYVAAR